MKTIHAFSLVAAGPFLAGSLLTGLFLTSTVSLAQTPTQTPVAPVGTASSSTIPQGTVKDDAMYTQYVEKDQGGKKKKKNKDQSGTKMSNGQASTEKRRYQESSSSDGTAVNNSNTTNYNSNNVTTAPTGAGSVPVPATTGTKSTTQPN
jgi:hypothetical protein